MTQRYSTHACKLGGFNLLHSIEDRSLHNTFFPKATIPAPLIPGPFDKRKCPSKQERLRSSPSRVRQLYDKASKRSLPPSVMQMQIKRVHNVDNDELGREVECLMLAIF